MRIANLNDRLVLIGAEGVLDVEKASGGRFSAAPQKVFDRWAEFREWASQAEGYWRPAEGVLGAPSPQSRQVFAIGLNYQNHADESGFKVPDDPVVFTKYPSSITGPNTEVVLPDGDVDWEVELVVVMGREAHAVDRVDGWSMVAGLTVGQDLSERRRQMAGPAPQFCMAKSFPGFSPTGPWLVTPDELADPDDLLIACDLDGETVQKDRTSSMVFSVPDLVARLSSIVTLYPGDLIFTGTPPGVGMGRSPQRFLAPGAHLRSYIEGIGELNQRFRSSARPEAEQEEDRR